MVKIFSGTFLLNLGLWVFCAPPVWGQSLMDLPLKTDAELQKNIKVLQAALLFNRTEQINTVVNERLNQILTRTSRAYEILQKWDELLAKEPLPKTPLQKNPLYQRLLESHQQLDVSRHRIMGLYLHLWRIALGKDPILEKAPSRHRPRLESRAQEVIDHFHEKISELQKDVRILALLQLRSDLGIVQQSLQKDFAGTDKGDRIWGRWESFQQLQTINKSFFDKRSEVGDLSHQEFQKLITRMDDAELEDRLKKPRRIPQSQSSSSKTWTLLLELGTHAETHASALKSLETSPISWKTIPRDTASHVDLDSMDWLDKNVPRLLKRLDRMMKWQKHGTLLLREQQETLPLLLPALLKATDSIQWKKATDY